MIVDYADTLERALAIEDASDIPPIERQGQQKRWPNGRGSARGLGLPVGPPTSKKTKKAPPP